MNYIDSQIRLEFSEDFQKLIKINSEQIMKQKMFELIIDLESAKFLKDHSVQGLNVLPGSFYLDIALSLFSNFYPQEKIVINDISFNKMIFLNKRITNLFIKIRTKENSEIDLLFFDEFDKLEKETTPIAFLVIGVNDSKEYVAFSKNHLPLEVGKLSGESFYHALYKNGNEYGPNFSIIQDLWIKDDTVLCQIDSKTSVIPNILNSTIIDSFTQTISALSKIELLPFILIKIQKINVNILQLPNKIFCKTKLISMNLNENIFIGDLIVFDEDNNDILEMQGVQINYLGESKSKEKEYDNFTINIVSTFTTDPITDSLFYWNDFFNNNYKININPYGQVFQQLLDSKSEFNKNSNGLNVIILGLEDWGRIEGKINTSLNKNEIDKLFSGKKRYILPNNIEIVHLNKYETEYVYNEIFIDKCYLRKNIEINDGDTIIDIGANIGLFTLFVNEYCKDPVVYSYEPSPVVYELLKINSEVYGKNVKTFNYGVSDRRKKAEFTFYEKSSVFSSFNANKEEDKRAIKAVVKNMFENEDISKSDEYQNYIDDIMQDRVESVPYNCDLISLNDIIEDNNIEKIDLLKVDAEKSELEILSGIKTEYWDKIRQIVVEIHDKTGKVLSEIKTLLINKGFSIAVVEEKLLKESGLFNLYAKREDKVTSGKVNAGDLQKVAINLDRNIKDLFLSVKSSINSSSTPTLIIVPPFSEEIKNNSQYFDEFSSAENKILNHFSSVDNVHTISSNFITDFYPVNKIFDSHGNKLGHIPYTREFFSSIGTALYRKILAINNKKYKVIILDCDNTIWKGICGEDGAQGIQLTKEYMQLQKFILDQINFGMLVCLVSKNNENDVFDVFRQREDMLLKFDSITSWKINWLPKSENIKKLAQELNLGLDSFIFIDDSPIECAEVRINCPEVLTFQFPSNEKNIPNYLKQIWPLDHTTVTQEDKQRTTFYREKIKRDKFKESSLNLSDFIKGLNLKIVISNVTESQMPRVSQLTYRTNQFNLTTIRRSEKDIWKLLDQVNYECLVTHVSDRFGDYGLVSILIYLMNENVLEVDTFLLSCRVLGRGVEYKILAELGKIANLNNKDFVKIKYLNSGKNKPALNFLDNIGSNFKVGNDDAAYYKFPAGYLSQLKYVPTDTENVKMDKKNTLSKKNYSDGLNSKFEAIAENFYDTRMIYEEVKNFSKTERLIPNDINLSQISSVEQVLSSIWKNVLGISNVGINENFFEIGGTSLKAVQIISNIKKELGKNLSIVSMFEYPTISKLSNKLTSSNVQTKTEANNNEIMERANRRRKRIKRGKR